MAKPKKGPKQKTAVKSIMTPAIGLRIDKGTFRGIDLDAAFPVVAKKQESFFGHKDILLQGICAWVKRSRKRTASRKAMAKATARHIAMAETKLTEKISANVKRKLGKAASSHLSTKKRVAISALGYLAVIGDREFSPLFHQVYLQIGGMSAVTDAYKSPQKHHTTKSKKQRARPKRDTGIRYLVALAAILDFHVRKLSTDYSRYGDPSILKATPLAGPLIKKTKQSKDKSKTAVSKALGKSQVNELLAEHKNAFALLYGADRVTVAEDTSLLDRILQKNPSLSDIAPYIVEWLSYTKYFSQTVLMKMKGQWEDTYSPSVPGVASRQPMLPELSKEHVRDIETAFASQIETQKREQFKTC